MMAVKKILVVIMEILRTNLNSRQTIYSLWVAKLCSEPLYRVTVQYIYF